jgi:dual specificity phosphatase 3
MDAMTPRALTSPINPLHPADWWRVLCFPVDNVAVCGDLDTSSDERAAGQLAEWTSAGITDIVDARGEWSDQSLVARLAPDVAYHWVGTDDLGRGQSDEWFDAGVDAAMGALTDPARKVVVHCHMGVNRGPSMAFAIMLRLGHDPAEALQRIRGARPIAGIIYAHDALRWWHRRIDADTAHRSRDRQVVDEWFATNPSDVEWIISNIRRAS